MNIPSITISIDPNMSLLEINIYLNRIENTLRLFFQYYRFKIVFNAREPFMIELDDPELKKEIYDALKNMEVIYIDYFGEIHFLKEAEK